MKTKTLKIIALSVATVAWLLLLAYCPLLWDVLVQPLDASAIANGAKPGAVNDRAGFLFMAMFLVIAGSGIGLFLAWVHTITWEAAK